ncbi:MAG TPA: GNAT family acetyltransferase [Frankiaceae bacterium]|nr:GNAT family acetyltransferase [Frankiaceae bacterium]
MPTPRPFTDADEDAVVALWERCGLTRPWNDPRRDIARKRTVQPELFLVVDDGGIVGSAMFGYDGHRGWVNYLAVDPAHRGRGLGRALMAEGERLLTALGCPKLSLQVRTSNAEAIAFYDALGYRPDEVVSYGKRLIPDT